MDRTLPGHLTSIPSAIKGVWTNLTEGERRGYVRSLVLLLIGSILDLGSLGALVPIILNRFEWHERLSMGTFPILWLILPGFFLLKNWLLFRIHRSVCRYSFGVYQSVSKRALTAQIRDASYWVQPHSSADRIQENLSLPFQFSENLLLPSIHFLYEFFTLALIALFWVFFRPIAGFWSLLFFVPLWILIQAWSHRGIRALRQAAYLQFSNILQEGYDLGRLTPLIQIRELESVLLPPHLEKVRSYSDTMVRAATYTILPSRWVEVFLVLGLFLLLSIQPDAALFAFMAMGAYRALPSLTRLSASISSILGYAFVLDRMPQITLEGRPRQHAKPFECIEFQNISFSYPNAKSLLIQDCSLRLGRGEWLGIQGTSGSGKTTLLHLMMGFLEPREGTVFLDGTPHSPASGKISGRNFGYVSQDLHLMNASVLENVTLNEKHPNLGRVEECLSMADAFDFTQTLPKGLETIIGEGGHPLSYGQRQRLCLARALYPSPSFLFLDEPTSFLDEKSESVVLKSISKLVESGLACVMVSHRSIALNLCDRIYDLSGEKDFNPLKAASKVS